MATTTFADTTLHTVGELPAVGSMAPGFSLVAPDLSEVRLSDFAGKRVVLNIFPSLDTPVCAASVRKFNVEASRLKDTEVLCVSNDLPFADARFCTVNDIDHVRALSAFRSSFGNDYGMTITDGPLAGLLARALVVIDRDGRVLATSLNARIAEEPDYDLVFNILK